MMRIQRQRDAFAWRLGAFASEEEYRNHIAQMEAKIADLNQRGVDSRTIHGIKSPSDRVSWSPKRRAQHKQLINDLYSQWSQGVPQEGKGMLLAGLGGSGKGNIQRHPHSGLDTDRYMPLDVDAIKEEMARRGMIPKIEGLSPMESSSLVHDEASDLAKHMARRAHRDKRNLLWDMTMSSDKSAQDRINDMRKAGYSQIDGALVDADPQTARKRVEQRHRRGQEAFQSGQGHGGRWVPEAVSASNLPTPGSGKLSRNAEVFERVMPLLDNAVAFDARGQSPRVTTTKGPRWHAHPLSDAGSTANPMMEARRLRMADAETPTLRGLIEAYEAGQVGLDQLLQIAATLPPSEHNPSRDIGERFTRAEESHDDNSFFWVEGAYHDDIFTDEQVQQIADALDQPKEQR